MVDGVEFIRFEVQGQSFMLHQIRRMIGNRQTHHYVFNLSSERLTVAW